MNSEEYWQRREKKWQEQQIKDDKARMAEIKKRMQDSQDAIQKEIDAQWDNFSNGQKISRSEAMKRADKMDVEAFARKAKRYVEEKNFSQEANRQLKLYNLTMRVNRLELLKANIGLELIATFNDLDKYLSKELTQAALDELRRQAGILGLNVPESGYGKLVEQVINSSFRTSDFPTFSDNLWQYQSELKADLDKLLVRGITQGKNPKQLASELAKYLTKEGVENTKYNTQRLMVTETARVQLGIQKQSYEDAGIKQYTYIAEPDACKQKCLPLNGKVFDVEDMEVGINATPMHPWCRCSTAPYVNREEIEKDLEERGL
jgi:SPP1 gp7 family putative phage head morphogenesis protein